MVNAIDVAQKHMLVGLHVNFYSIYIFAGLKERWHSSEV
jgi:hypothetical protein